MMCGKLTPRDTHTDTGRLFIICMIVALSAVALGMAGLQWTVGAS